MDNMLNISVPEKPARKDGLTCEEMEGMDEVIFVDSETGSNFSVNLAAAAVLDLCDGHHTVEDIAGFLSETMHTDRQRALIDTQAILSEFVAYGVIRAD
ncbi:MAG: PqqD family protein [Mariprofundaceae bacterium]|nr:PqqD family protein [Mariprofundaceae bacterium]